MRTLCRMLVVGRRCWVDRSGVGAGSMSGDGKDFLSVGIGLWNDYICQSQANPYALTPLHNSKYKYILHETIHPPSTAGHRSQSKKPLYHSPPTIAIFLFTNKSLILILSQRLNHPFSLSTSPSRLHNPSDHAKPSSNISEPIPG